MNKMRKSRTAKILFLITAIISTAFIIFTVAAGAILYFEDLIYASKESISKKAYSYVYNHTEADLYSYLYTVEKNSVTPDYDNYNKTELEIFRNKYSSEASNISFKIKDDSGNVLLAGGDGSDGIYFSSDFRSASSFPGSMCKTGFIEIYNSDILNKDTDSRKNNKDNRTEDIKIVKEHGETILHYVSDGHPDNRIKEGLIEIVSCLPYNISDITLFESDFMYNEDNSSLTNRYDIESESGDTVSLETDLNTGYGTAHITYTYTGSFSFNKFTARLSEAACSMYSAEGGENNFDYTQKKYPVSKINVYVKYPPVAKDAYYYAEKAVTAAVFFRDNIFFFAFISMLLLVLSLIFIFYSAGYVKKYEMPVARGLHAIPFDLTVFLLLALDAAVLIVSEFTFRNNLSIIIALILLFFILIWLTYTAVTRKRAGTLKSNNLIYKLFNFVRKYYNELSEDKRSLISFVIVPLFFILFQGAEILAVYILSLSFPVISGPLTFLFLKLFEIPFIILIIAGFRIIRTGAEKLAEGDLSSRINTNILIGPFRKTAENLNKINTTVDKAVKERLKSESFRTQLITNVSHDLKTPLTSIVNYVDLLKKEKLDNEKAEKYVEVIDRQSQRLKRLTSDIVEASKAATGNVEVHRENTALNVLLQQTAGEYTDKLKEKELTLIEDIPSENICIMTDGRLLWRITENLMNNICKYSLEGSRVYISLNVSEGKASITFKNISKSALNIDPDALAERFIRGDASRNTEGSGLGLSIAKSLTEALGGEMKISIDGDLFKVLLLFPF